MYIIRKNTSHYYHLAPPPSPVFILLRLRRLMMVVFSVFWLLCCSLMTMMMMCPTFTFAWIHHHHQQQHHYLLRHYEKRISISTKSSSSPLNNNKWHFPINLEKRQRQRQRHSIILQQLQSTPFELDYYDDGDNNPFDDSNASSSPLACPSDTKLVLGLNKYSHDTSICAADITTGKVLFGISKERLTRKKCDGGNVALLVEKCLDTLNLDYDSIVKVIMNNHHHRILPTIESNFYHMEWESGLGINGGIEDGYDDEFNLLSDIKEKMELSHHLAHAYSTATQSPFNKGLIVVMDGMGGTYREMIRAQKLNDPTYVSDFTLLDNNNNDDDDDTSSSSSSSFQIIPSDIKEQSQYSFFDYREAESVYVFEKLPNTINIKPIFKRFTPENTPPTLYNHGFENMDSVGALYSRASSHIFGDWNACGKVMGLAPWIETSWKKKKKASSSAPTKMHTPMIDDDDDNSNSSSSSSIENEEDHNIINIKPKKEQRKIMWGAIYSEEDDLKFQQDKTVMMGMPLISRMDSDLFDDDANLIHKRRYDFDDYDDDENNNNNNDEGSTTTTVDDMSGSSSFDGEELHDEEPALLPTKVALDAISLANRIQVDLESVLIDFVKHFKEMTSEENLCIAGGVGLNSVLNGRLSRELGFENTYVSPYPGDDGIAVGCCAFGLFGNHLLDGNKQATNSTNAATDDDMNQIRPPVWSEPLPPYLGPEPTENEIKQAIDAASPWLDFEAIRDEDTLLTMVAEELESGGVVAWYNGRSEMGPRALGHRSILADPRKKGLVRFINQFVKFRESFRPFAPSVLEEYASEWFDLGDTSVTSNKSPYMSLTAMVHKDKRKRIPAVTHTDGSSRLQTVTQEAEPLYHKLISKFYELTGVPLVLNTSFNTLPGEPIVESPTDAIRSFLCSMGSIEMVVMGDYVVKRKPANLQSLLGETTKGGDMMVAPTCPKRSGPATFRTSFDADEGELNEEDVETKTSVRMPNRPMHHSKAEWFDILDELEGELLSVCDGQNSLNEIIAHYTTMNEDDDMNKERVEEAEVLLQNIVHRLVRLYENTLISW